MKSKFKAVIHLWIFKFFTNFLLVSSSNSPIHPFETKIIPNCSLGETFSDVVNSSVQFILHYENIIGTGLRVHTGKSLSEALIFASTNPQYDNRLFIELQVQYMKIPSSNLGRTCCVQKLFLTFRTIFVHNMFSPCSAKRRASDKDLPVFIEFVKKCDELVHRIMLIQ